MSVASADPLHRLAALHGVENRYVDAFGHRREVPRDSLRELLVAMGVEPFGERQIADRLRELERRRAARLADPVVVLTEAERQIPIHLPNPSAETEVLLELETDSGETVEKTVPTDRLSASPDGGPEHRMLPLGRRLPIGEHRLVLSAGPKGRRALRAEVELIVTPERCLLPEDLERDRLFGFAAQLYGLRSGRQHGIGDFADLQELCRRGARRGASLIGVNPLHALFPAEPGHFSPYSPSNRSFLNPVYIALDRAAEREGSEQALGLLGDLDLAAALERARAAELVDYPAVWSIKARVLEALFASFRERHLRPALETDRGRAFLSFAREMGRPLFLQACFDVLHETMLKEHGLWSWRDWPQSLRHPDGPEVGAFAAAHSERVAFFQWLQWVADEQLEAAQHEARQAGASVGLYRDLAVGVHPDGASAWSFPDVTIAGASIGAPPDAFNQRGQNWGLAPFSPSRS